MLPEIFEIIMVVLFGVSWPLNIVRSYRARTARGKSLWFLLCILVGYVAGIVSKFINPAYLADIGRKWYVVFFYILNFIMVSIDLMLYFRNVRLDALRAASEENAENEEKEEANE